MFICHRRDDSPDAAGRIADHFMRRCGEDEVFFDIDSLYPGVRWAEVIERTLATCHIVLVLIGPGWEDLTDEDGNRKLDDPDDFVRQEIRTALERQIYMVPILVGGRTDPPRPKGLPVDIRELLEWQVQTVTSSHFRTEIERVEGVIDDAEAKREADAEAKRNADAEAEAKRNADAEAEAKRKAEAEAKRKAEADVKRKAEAEAKRKAEADAEAETEARRQAAAGAMWEAEHEAVAERPSAGRAPAIFVFLMIILALGAVILFATGNGGDDAPAGADPSDVNRSAFDQANIADYCDDVHTYIDTLSRIGDNPTGPEQVELSTALTHVQVSHGLLPADPSAEEAATIDDCFDEFEAAQSAT